MVYHFVCSGLYKWKKHEESYFTCTGGSGNADNFWCIEFKVNKMKIILFFHWFYQLKWLKASDENTIFKYGK